MPVIEATFYITERVEQMGARTHYKLVLRGFEDDFPGRLGIGVPKEIWDEG